MTLTARAKAFEGKTVELTKSGIGVCTMEPTFRVLRRTVAGEQGVVLRATDAGFNGLEFRIRLTATGEHITAREANIKVVG